MPRRTLWQDEFIDLQVANNGQEAASLVSVTTAVERAGWTLIRMILCVDFGILIPNVNDSVTKVSVGIGIESQEAFAAGTHPDPKTTGDYPVGGWLWHCQYRVADATIAHMPPIHVDKDLRAARMLKNGELFIVVDNVLDIGASQSIVLSGLVRCLFKV